MYEQRDVSSTTSGRVNGSGRGHCIGALMHTTSGTNSLAWLQGRSADAGSPASADYLIDRLGKRFKITPDGRYPYHAGQSTFDIRGVTYAGDALSRALLGIELESLVTEKCTPEQLDSAAELIVQLSIVFSWRWPYYILGHYEVARPVGRRSDPLGFEWGDFMGRLYFHAKVAGIAGL